MNTMTREMVIQSIASATTWEEMQRAEELLTDWLVTYPEDTAMLDAGEVLTMAKEDMNSLPYNFLEENKSTVQA